MGYCCGSSGRFDEAALKKKQDANESYEPEKKQRKLYEDFANVNWEERERIEDEENHRNSGNKSWGNLSEESQDGPK